MSVFKNRKNLSVGFTLLFITALSLTLSDPAYADLEGSIRNIKSQLSGVVLPLLSVIGLLFASFSYMTGNPNSRQHVLYALIGAGLGFGAQSIIDFISSMVH
ncbi:MAG: TrbC/VirB2 family protein [Pseudobdellovibrionaceae bacterium]